MNRVMDSRRPAAFAPEMATGKEPEGHPGWDLGTERRLDDGQTLARFLGWFSLGLGAVELFAPGHLSRYLGMRDRKELFQLYGLREAGTGIGILNQRKPVNWIRARVAGDLLDLATLAGGLDGRNRHRSRVVGAMAAVAGVTLLDLLCSRQLSETIDHRVQSGSTMPLHPRPAGGFS